MDVVIPAGGKGTRLLNHTKDKPKSMVSVAGIPMLVYLIKFFRGYNLKNFHILTGHMSEYIEENLGDGSSFDVKIMYHHENKALGTAGSVRSIEHFLNDYFLLVYSDVFLNMDLGKFVNFALKKKGMGSLVCHPNKHPSDSDLLLLGRDDRIIDFFPKPHSPKEFFPNMVNAGLSILSPRILKKLQRDFFYDFGKDVYPNIINEGHELFGYHTSEYICDMGTLDRLEKVSRDVKNKRPRTLNLTNKQKAVFLDRDGTLIKFVHLISNLEDVKLLPSVVEALNIWEAKNYLIIVVTNQPQVARGILTEEEVEKMHHKIDTLLGAFNAKVDKYYFCPHHPDKGFKGERKSYKIECDCRKPKPGLYLEASKKFNIDLKKSIYVGDSLIDIAVTQIVGGRSILLEKTRDRPKHEGDFLPDFVCSNLHEAAKLSIMLDNDNY